VREVFSRVVEELGSASDHEKASARMPTEARMITKYVLIRSQINRFFFSNNYNCYAGGYGECALSTSNKVLLRRDRALLEIVLYMLEMLEGVFCVLESLESVRHTLDAVENCTLYAIGTVGDALCAEVVEVVLYVFEAMKACAVCRSIFWTL